MRALWVLVLSFALLYPARLHAQNRAAEIDASVALTAGAGAPASLEFDPYLALLGRYEAGDYQGAADAALRLDVNTAPTLARQILDDVDREMVRLRRLKAASPEASTRGFLNQLSRERVRRLKLTLLVHTEAAVRVSDVRALGGQLTLARDAVGRLRRLEEDFRINGPLDTREPEPGMLRSDEPPPSQEPRGAVGRPDWEAMKLFIRDWYLVVASHLQLGGHLAFLKKHVTEGLELLRDDPELLLARPGPKLLLVMTDGRNNASWLQASPVIDAARRHETVIYPVAVDIDTEWNGVVRPRFGTGDAAALLKVMADETGGRYVKAGWDSSLGETFQQILREYRQRYILTFTPEGVQTGDGWHALEVKVKRGGALVRARTRYWAGKERERDQ